MKRNIIGIYLAAGKSSRMGQSKLSIKLWKDERLGSIALKQAIVSDLDRIIIVTKNEDNMDWLPNECIEDELGGRCQRVVCHEAAQGIAYSLRSGLAAAQALAATAVVVMLADQPFLTSGMINRLIEQYRKNPRLQFIASGDGKQKKPPILWEQSMFALIMSLKGDEGARFFLESPDYNGIAVAEPLHYRFLDADTVEDIEEIKKWGNSLGC
jgi:molybdenum cofactor cytidylyltransferase